MYKNSKIIIVAVVLVVAIVTIFIVIPKNDEQNGNEEVTTPKLTSQGVSESKLIVDKDEERKREVIRERLLKLNSAFALWEKIENYRKNLSDVELKRKNLVSVSTIISQLDNAKNNKNTNGKVKTQLLEGTLRSNLQLLGDQLSVISVLSDRLEKVRIIRGAVAPGLSDWVNGQTLLPRVEELMVLNDATNATQGDLNALLVEIEANLDKLISNESLKGMWDKVGFQHTLLNTNIGQNIDFTTEAGKLLDQVKSIADLQSLMTSLYELASIKSEISGINSAWLELGK